jgi:DNA-binding HxlR family transcriptional regulator
MHLFRRQIMILKDIEEHSGTRFKELRRRFIIHPIYLLRDLKMLKRKGFIIRSGNPHYYRFRVSFKGYLLLRKLEFEDLYQKYLQWETGQYE